MMLRIGEAKMYYSEDMGITWVECSRTGTKGSVAISADGKIFFYSPESSGKTYRSIDKGTTWTEVSGLNINWARVTTDYINPKLSYVYNATNGNFLTSTDGGVSFSQKTSPGSGGSKIIRAVPGKEGEVWVPMNNGGLSRTTNSGSIFNKITNVTYCGAVGFGKPAPGKTFPTVYIWGTVSGALGVHRSTDEGATWKRVNDGLHEYGGPANGQFVIGDMNVYGRVYMSTAGRGIVYGESDLSCEPTQITPKIKVGDEPVKQTGFIEVGSGQSVRLSPEAGSGTWSWSGPNEFSSTQAEIVFASITGEQTGIYTVTFTNSNGCVSAGQSFLINVVVQPQSIIVKGENNATVVDVVDGTLQLTAEFTPSSTTDKTVVWSIEEGEESATLSGDGLLTAVDDGSVTVRATSQMAPSVFGELVIVISDQNITGTEGDMSGVTMYPNPVRSVLTIQGVGQAEALEFISSDGRTRYTVGGASNEMLIDVNHFPTGVYILKIIQPGKSYFRRLVKF
jgi:xyloglucan-specific exo-beta-1,4-glucanase